MNQRSGGRTARPTLGTRHPSTTGGTEAMGWPHIFADATRGVPRSTPRGLTAKMDPPFQDSIISNFRLISNRKIQRLNQNQNYQIIKIRNSEILLKALYGEEPHLSSSRLSMRRSHWFVLVWTLCEHSELQCEVELSYPSANMSKFTIASWLSLTPLSYHFFVDLVMLCFGLRALATLWFSVATVGRCGVLERKAYNVDEYDDGDYARVAIRTAFALV